MFVVLVFLMVCTVGSVLIAMVTNKPLVVGAGDRVDVGAAGRDRVPRRCCTATYFCEHVSRCFVGLDPLLRLAA